MNKPHKHAKYIKAWADGETIQFWSNIHQDWKDDSNPLWALTFSYRIKPREFEEGAFYPIVLSDGKRTVAKYLISSICGEVFETVNGYALRDELKYIGEKLEINWPEEAL